MKELTEYAMFLNSYGFKVDIDRINEPLDHLSVKIILSGQPAEDDDQEPIMGFLETDPEKYESHDEEVSRRHKRLRASLAQGLDRDLSAL